MIQYANKEKLIFQDWDNKAQLEQENADCGLAEHGGYTCNECQHTFSARKHLRYHTKKCSQVKYRNCEKTFADMFLHKKHELIHSGNIQCDTCQKPSKQSLQRHASVHTKERLSCPWCDVTFSFDTNLKTHIRKKTCTIK